jgi:hypothetical protein
MTRVSENRHEREPERLSQITFEFRWWRAGILTARSLYGDPGNRLKLWDVGRTVCRGRSGIRILVPRNLESRPLGAALGSQGFAAEG